MADRACSHCADEGWNEKWIAGRRTRVKCSTCGGYSFTPYPTVTEALDTAEKAAKTGNEQSS